MQSRSPNRKQPAWRALAAVAASLVLSACETRELQDAPPPQFAADVAPILEARCRRCHEGAKPDGAWSATGYVESIGCTHSGVPVTEGEDDSPLWRVLEQPNHSKWLDDGSRSTLRAWVNAGAPSLTGALHPEGWLDPRSPYFHGTALREDGYVLMLGLRADGACGQCHRGGPVQSAELSGGPSRAPDCTSCHRAEGAVLACGTCHGDGAERAYPPRDPCYFPDGPAAGAHAAHVTPSKLRDGTLSCSTCHPAVDLRESISGRHTDGTVDVVFDPALAGEDAQYDKQKGTCAVACHGASSPVWAKPTKLDCNGCHSSPPAEHYLGECSACHPGVNAEGSALADTSWHINGRVDLGHDGSGRCGTCHGDGEDDPWPETRAHPAHRNPDIAPAVTCVSCHAVPTKVRAAGHLDRSPGAELHFSGPAVARGADASYEQTRRVCSNVACHGAGLTDSTGATPQWRAAQPGEAVCGSCHAAPPGLPHIQDTGCSASICHGAEISQWPEGPRITDSGRAIHIDGVVDVNAR